MLENSAKTAFDIWYYYDENIYKDSIEFPEFYIILKVVKDNNLFDLTKKLPTNLKLVKKISV